VKKNKAEHKRLVIFLPSTGETKEEPTEDKKKTTDENKSYKKQKPKTLTRSVVDRGYCKR
tara:strand:+ start:64 stop:243 length:180 start_codon:yes stop_codon:yes gene_type:complete